MGRTFLDWQAEAERSAERSRQRRHEYRGRPSWGARLAVIVAFVALLLALFYGAIAFAALLAGQVQA